MKQKIVIAALMILFGTISITCFFVGCSADHTVEPAEQQNASIDTQKKKEITIRNVTKETISYSIRQDNYGAEWVNRTIEVGAIDRFPGSIAMEIEFQYHGMATSYTLDPGTPYSFRYNENEELELYEGSHGRADAPDLAPFVPTPLAVVEKMLEMAELDKDDVLYDLGCGDGRIVIAAARDYGARAVGIDLDLQRIKESKANAKLAGVEKLVEFRQQDITKADFSEATVVTLYLLFESNEFLLPLLEKQLKPGVYVISHNYSMAGWEDKKVGFVSLKAEDGKEHDIYVYRR